MATMKAARWHAAKDIRVEETSIPSPMANQVKIAVKFAGICGSDLHEYTHGPQLIPVEKPYPLNGHQGITTLGHESSGLMSLSTQLGHRRLLTQVLTACETGVPPYWLLSSGRPWFTTR